MLQQSITYLFAMRMSRLPNRHKTATAYHHEGITTLTAEPVSAAATCRDENLHEDRRQLDRLPRLRLKETRSRGLDRLDGLDHSGADRLAHPTSLANGLTNRLLAETGPGWAWFAS